MRSSRHRFVLRPAGPLRKVQLVVALLVALLAQSPAVLADGVAWEMTRTQRLARLQAMTPAQRVQFGQRVAAWNALPSREREERRAHYQAWLQLDAAERDNLRMLAAQVAAFPPERKQALRAQFDALDDVQKHGWRLGPALGSDYPSLHPLLAYLPASQRLPLLARLRNMDAPQRGELAVLAQRTPPQDRQALRSELLSVPPSQLGAWLQRKLAQ